MALNPVVMVKLIHRLCRVNVTALSQGRFEANMANDTCRFYLLLFIHNFLNSVYI